MHEHFVVVGLGEVADIMAAGGGGGSGGGGGG
jgi:hypothetical protein